MIKAVPDTNQFVSSIIVKKGIPAQLIQAWQKFSYVLITSKTILEEIEQVLHYPRLIKKYCLKPEEINQFIRLIENYAVVLTPTIKINVIKDDPDDNEVLACAQEAEADYIVSGDTHLLDLGKYKNIPIVTAREFLERISSVD